MLADVETYCNPWGMKLNVNKTRRMRFELRRPTSYTFCIFIKLF